MALTGVDYDAHEVMIVQLLLLVLLAGTIIIVRD